MDSNSTDVISNVSTEIKPFVPPPVVFVPKTYTATYPFDPYIYYLIEIIMRVGVTGFMAVFGLVANVLNIILFLRQGLLSEGSTVSLFGLAIADFFNCLLLVVADVFICIMWYAPRWGAWTWDVRDFYSAIAVRPRTICTQIACWVTAYIAIERFISVVFPFKVKQIINPKRSCFIIACIFVGTIGLYYPQYTRLTLIKINFPWGGYQYKFLNLRKMSDGHYNAFLYIHPVALRTLALVIVFICNIVIMWKVVISTKFRKTSANTQGGGNSNPGDSATTDKSKNTNKDSKEQKLVRMMVIVCVVFLICTIPDTVYVFVLYVSHYNFHWYIAETAYAVSGVFEIFSSSVNIFIYYSLSTRYRKEFDQFCGRSRKGGKNATSSAMTSGDSGSSTKMVSSITTKH